MSIREKILEYMSREDYTPISGEDLLIKFNLEDRDSREFFKILKDLEKEGLIIQNSNKKYGVVNNKHLFSGVLQGHEKGFAFLVADTDIEDIYIPSDKLNGAMDGDRVIVNLIKKSEFGKSEEGEVIKILERNNKIVVGTFQKSKNFGFVIPDNKRLHFDVFVPKSKMKNAKNGQKVVVEINKWPKPRRNPEGIIKEIIGYSDDPGVDILSIIKQYNLPEEFPKDVRKYVNNINFDIHKNEIERREDFRNIKTFTIDGYDAKDLDDAISIKKLENGNFLLGVHIADVSYYVEEGSTLDREAFKRGNSVYLLDRVIPMLPKELSNGICSLNPNVDRLTLSVIMEISKKGEVIKHRITESVINSKGKLIYDDISEYIEKNKIDKSIENFLIEINYMYELMKILEKGRKKRGSIDFNFPETKIVLDEKGLPLVIEKEVRGVANKIIEEFMLVTNEVVAEEYYWSETPFIYRIHEEPDEESINEFSRFIFNLGYKIKGKDIHPKDFQKLTDEIKGKDEELVISTLLLRSLKKAKYSETSDIHFGLATKYYSHFTAPIRRYSDLIVHRIIKENLNGRLNQKSKEDLEANLGDICKHVSATERQAESAEREVQDLKKAQYMYNKIGNEYDGIISSITNFGIFVQLENTIEGLIHFRDMIDDYYYFDQTNFIVEGQRNKKQYKLGQKVKIKVVSVDLEKRSIDFEFI